MEATPIAIEQALKGRIRKEDARWACGARALLVWRKTHLGHLAIAAVNVIQLMSWLRGEAPEQTRTSPFKRVMEQAA